MYRGFLVCNREALAAPAKHYMMVCVLDCFHNVCDNCTGGWQFAGTASVEHGSSKHISFYHDPVEYIIHGIQRVVFSDHDRCYPGMNLFSVHAAGTKQLYRGSKLVCILKVHICDFGNTFCADVLVVYFFSCCHRCEDRDLTAGIVAFYVCLWVALCITKRLGLF